MTVSTEDLADQLRSHIRLASGESLYGVVDGAQDLELAYEAKCLYGQEIRSLFEGPPAAALAEVAPYAVLIDPDSSYLTNWADRWGTNAGILLTTTAGFDELQAHLRKIFIAEDESGQEYFFRYYDPRVLRVYLPTCVDSEIDEFFGPLRSIFLESDLAAEMLHCRSTNGGQTEVKPLQPNSADGRTFDEPDGVNGQT